MSFDIHLKNGIVILGAGNVATHISIALKKAGFHIKTVYSRTLPAAQMLAQKIDTQFTIKTEDLPLDADLYILALKDEVIEDLLSQIKPFKGIIVHTAGSISIDVFKAKFLNYGVFYPLQTFSKDREVDFSIIPICIESSSTIVETELINLAKTVSNSYQVIDSEKRKILHLAAVFAGNFSNHMYSVASELLYQSDISFDLIKPLISETTKKAIEMSPDLAQTGPAVRNDQKVIHKHLQLLQEMPEFEKIYQFVSESIFKSKNRKNRNG